MMTSCKKTAVSAFVLSLTMAGSAAFADVTAEQVWEDWQSYMAASGYVIEADTSRSGDTLTISDLTMTMEIPEEDVKVILTMADMGFVDNGDGTVSIDIPQDLPFDIAVVGPPGTLANIGMNYKTQGLATTVSGDADNMTYTYSAASIGISLEEVLVEGAPVDFGTAEIEITNIAGTTEMTVTDLRRSVQKVTTGPINYLLDISDPEGGEGRLVWRGEMGGSDMRADMALPLGVVDFQDIAAVLESGFMFDAEIRADGGSSEFNFQEAGEVVQISSSSTSGALSASMSKDALGYAIETTGMELSMAGGDIPFPIEMASEEIGINLSMPVAASDQEQDFAFGMTLGDFTVSDLIWGLFDPAGELPRDPATIDIGIAGTAKLFFDLMDPAQMADVETGAAMPGELNSLNINTLTVSAVGAELTGEGAFTFDNTDLSTFDGLPAPTGAINLMLVGGNTLLDRLIGMGLVPEEEAMGVRMMMGLFAVPGDGEDTLTSKIEVQGDGQVLANGQRIR